MVNENRSKLETKYLDALNQEKYRKDSLINKKDLIFITMDQIEWCEETLKF